MKRSVKVWGLLVVTGLFFMSVILFSQTAIAAGSGTITDKKGGKSDVVWDDKKGTQTITTQANDGSGRKKTTVTKKDGSGTQTIQNK
ncbi:MAG TPA: hypothetical protein VN328_13330, partial [Thermodesulfovibrionales bacterium]|nr:hypothetical protein [Thermodesulfovibrionales bacterium]